MDLPEKCPQCRVKWGEAIQTDEKTAFPYLNVRTDLDFDSIGSDARIEDQIYECSECHTLFRARWQLVSFVQLVEKPQVIVDGSIHDGSLTLPDGITVNKANP